VRTFGVCLLRKRARRKHQHPHEHPEPDLLDPGRKLPPYTPSMLVAGGANLVVEDLRVLGDPLQLAWRSDFVHL
jgi:hypothetical protein